MVKGSLEVKLLTNGQMKTEVERVREEKTREEKGVRRDKIKVREKIENTNFADLFWLQKADKKGLLKRRIPSHLARREMKNCTQLWCEADLKTRPLKTPRLSDLFGS